MSYKVELSEDEHVPVLLEALTDWSTQDHDVHLISSEGHRIHTNKMLLSFYSPCLQKIFNDPVIQFSSQAATLSVPAPANSISSLVKLLASGTSTAVSDNLQEVKEAAKALDIKLKNCDVNRKKVFHSKSSSGGGGLTVIKLPFKNDLSKATAPGPVQVPRPFSVKPRPFTMNPIQVQSKSNIFSKTVSTEVKRPSGLRIELKEFVDEETAQPDVKPFVQPSESVSKNIKRLSDTVELKQAEDGTLFCEVCDKGFNSKKNVFRHRLRKHGLKAKQTLAEGYIESNVDIKTEKPSENVLSCSTCGKVLDSEAALERHIRKRHTDRKVSCDECNKQFKKANDLTVHKRIHLPDSEKPFKCDYCEKTFCQSGQRRIHIKNFHPQETVDQNESVNSATDEDVPTEESNNGIILNTEEDPIGSEYVFEDVTEAGVET